VRFHVALNRIPYLLKEALPLGPALMISVCYLKLDALMLVILRTPAKWGSTARPISRSSTSSWLRPSWSTWRLCRRGPRALLSPLPTGR
jgi:hypothetical protein